MDLFKALFSPGKKQLGLPSQMPWTYAKGLWMPFNNKDETYINKAYKVVPIIQSIVSKIIDKASDAPGQVMRIKEERTAKGYFLTVKGARSGEQIMKAKGLKTKAFEQMDSHPFMEVMENPNPMMSGKELRESSMGYLLITGNSFEYMASTTTGTRSGQPKELWSIPSPSVHRNVGTRRQPIESYSIAYNINEDIDPYSIMDVKYWNPVYSGQEYLESYNGLSPLASSAGLVSQKKYSDIAQGTLFANMAPAGIISGNSNEHVEFTPEQGQDINDHFRNNHMGVHNAGDIFVTPADVRWEEIGLSPVDLDILNFNKDLERQIANIYSWPVEFLDKGGVISNSEQAAKKVITDCVMPLLRRFDDARTRKLREWYKDDRLVYISDLGFYPELEVNKKELAEWMRTAGVFTQGEIRNALDYDAEYDASEVLVPSGYTPLSDIQGGDLPIDEESGDFSR